MSMIKKYLKNHVSPEERQIIIDELRLKQYNNKISKNEKSFKTIHKKIIQRQLQMRMIKKYLKKDISPDERQNIIDNLRSIMIV